MLQVVQRRAHLVAVQEEDVLAVREEAVRHEDVAELAHLVPEDRVVPVLHVEVVVLDVRVDRARELDELANASRSSSVGKQLARTRR